MSAAEIILVAGLGRCGTSLMMQMLSAGGVPCIGAAPSFEDSDHNALRRTDPGAWVAAAAGHAVKVLNPHSEPIPAGPSYRTLFMFREWADQARSTLKVVGVDQRRGNRKRVERQLKDDTDRASAAMHDAGATNWQIVPFDCLLLRPRETAGLVGRFLQRDLDIEAMVACVVARPPECLPYLLELSMLSAAA